MSTLNPPISETESISDEDQLESPSFIVRTFESMTENLNPILIKETRQALKGKQFAISYSLSIIGVILITVLFCFYTGSDLYYTAQGDSLFCWYLGLVAFAGLVFIPFGAYFSLSSERESKTHELVSLTVLKPREIIFGKLLSAFFQLTVFLSVVIPCMVLTYFLRGIDILLMGYSIIALCLASYILSSFALLLGSIANTSMSRSLSTIILVPSLLLAWWGFVYLFVEEIIRYQDMYLLRDTEVFVYVSLFFAKLGIAIGVLLILLAAANLTFKADNKSTPLRIFWLITTCIFSGWAAAIMIESEFNSRMEDFAKIYVNFAFIFWSVAAVVMVGESPIISERTRRTLPTNPLTRALSCWFYPGPALGMFYSLGALFTCIVFVIFLAVSYSLVSGSTSNFKFEEYVIYSIFVWLYFCIYLSALKLMATGLRKRYRFHPMGNLLVILLVIGLGVMISLSVRYAYEDYAFLDTTLVTDVFNPFIILPEVYDHGILSHQSVSTMIFVFAILVVSASAGMLIHFGSLIREMGRFPMAIPQRVSQDIKDTEVEKANTQEKRLNPWGDEVE